jgi:hypothetical protein
MGGVFMVETYQRSSESFDAPVAESVMLLNVGTGRYHELNAEAGRIWELLATPKTVDELVLALTSEFEVGVEECRTEVMAFLARLRERKLLVGD